MRANSRIISIFLFIGLLLSTNVFAGETGKIAGTVTDANTGAPLIGANVIISSIWIDGVEHSLDFIQGSASDLEGRYFILNVRPGVYSLKVNFIGYGTQIITQVVVNVDKTTTVNFELQPQAIEGEAVTVVAQKVHAVESDLTATKQVYQVSDVQSIAGVADIADIISLQADVVDDHFRGGREGESRYILGGGVIVNPLNNSRAFRPIVTGLEQVEVYTSGFSAEYGNAQSGVINMVTKEGRSEWESRLEFSLTLPHYKSWQEVIDKEGNVSYKGGSPYSANSMDFYSMLDDEEEWLVGYNPVYQLPIYDSGTSFTGIYFPNRVVWPPNPLGHSDSLQLAHLVMTQFMLAMRDIGLEYKNTMDNRLDFSTGGPISDHMRIFIAGRQNTEYCIIPTSKPDLNQQIMSSLVYQKNIKNKFKFTFTLDNTNETYFSSSWRYWLLDPTLATSQISTSSRQYGLEWGHVVNDATFLEVKLNQLNLLREEYIPLLNDGEYLTDYMKYSNWTDYTTPSNLRVGRPNDDSGTEKSITWSFSSNVTSQINHFNMLKGGLQFFYYDLNIDYLTGRYTESDLRVINYKGNPYEGALYLQDKLEFEGLIANIGLRTDFYQLNTEYYTDIYSPLRNPYYNPDAETYIERGNYYSDSLALRTKTDLYINLQPRIGISFPVSEYTVFHLNYGTFTQRPNFEQLFFSEFRLSGNDYEIVTLGNPRLKPEITQSYDIGIVQGIGQTGVTLDISAYYKDVKDLVETAYYYDEQEQVYQTYINRDYADIKGFHVNLEKKSGYLRSYIRYNYESATGKSSNALNAPVTYFEKEDPKYGYVDLPDPQDIYLDYDRTHKLVVNLRVLSPRQFGPKMLGIYPLEDISISGTMRFMTGRPYTDPSQGVLYGERTPNERNVDMRVEKSIRLKKRTATLYTEVFNLLNEPTWSYSRTFNNPYNTPRWITNRDNILTYEEYSPFVTSQDIYLLTNEPRNVRVGLIFKF
ncbi:MAG TPA: carboxypeptidase regulatory-like domain-containing protein [Candidatus Marinimicrobia bacterium]|nr:carboxypeptidase regulatory-like domain-containing protein [Candidatus Neomarinimicrobiota bacterium]